MERVEATVTYAEYTRASLATKPGTTQQEILMKLFEEKGIRLMSDSMEATPPVQLTDEPENQRFVIRQEQ